MKSDHKTGAFRALRKMNPRQQEHFADEVNRNEDLFAAIVFQPTDIVGEAVAAGYRPAAASTARPRPRRRTLGLSAAGAAVIIAGVVAAVVLLTGGPSGAPSPAFAAEAVKKAAVDTATAAKSGVVETALITYLEPTDVQMNDHRQEVASRTFLWNGDDLAIRSVDGKSEEGTSDSHAGELRYVDGRLYEKGYFSPAPEGEDGTWTHYTTFDNGGGYDFGAESSTEPFVPSKWLEQYRSALVGSGLLDLVTNVSGLTQKATQEGGATYTGTVEVARLLTYGLDLSGVAFAGGQPLEKMNILDPKIPVAVEVVVDKAGLISNAKFDYEFEGSTFTYKVAYGHLGSAPRISAPDAANTITKDHPFHGDVGA